MGRVRWPALIALTAAGALAGDTVGLPSPTLLSGMLAGIAVALWWPAPGEAPGVPGPALHGAEALVGVVLGTYVELSTLQEIARELVPILLVTAATLGATVLSGLALSRMTGVDRATAAFGMIAGGATGVIVIARELGADQRLVAVMQYLRVLVVIALTPVLAATAFGSAGGPAAPAMAAGPLLGGLVFAAVATALGLLVARRAPIPAPTLLVPMLGVAALQVAGAPGIHPVPAVAQDLAFAVIGLQVGLRFTPESLRRAGRILLPTLGLIAALLVVCFGLALALAALTGVSVLDAYLATTPGGLYAVLGTAVGSGADTTFVLAVQVLRLFVMLLAAPLLAKRLLPARPAVASAPG
jgi:uncharacterized protein